MPHFLSFLSFTKWTWMSKQANPTDSTRSRFDGAGLMNELSSNVYRMLAKGRGNTNPTFGNMNLHDTNILCTLAFKITRLKITRLLVWTREGQHLLAFCRTLLPCNDPSEQAHNKDWSTNNSPEIKARLSKMGIAPASAK